jgi:hypothetical protein
MGGGINSQKVILKFSFVSAFSTSEVKGDVELERAFTRFPFFATLAIDMRIRQ